MNDRGAHDLEESRTRRSVLAVAGGLLLPAGLLIGGADEAEATKRAKRRRRRRRRGQVGLFANDVIINFRNATSESLAYRYSSLFAGSADEFREIKPGAESGFAAGFPASDLTTTGYLDIRLSNFDPYSEGASYRVTCRNHEIGAPDAAIVWFPDPRKKGKSENVSGKRDMGEGTMFDITHNGYRFTVHRWSNGKEPIDEYDEWYTRFFVTIADA